MENRKRKTLQTDRTDKKKKSKKDANGEKSNIVPPVGKVNKSQIIRQSEESLNQVKSFLKKSVKKEKSKCQSNLNRDSSNNVSSSSNEELKFILPIEAQVKNQTKKSKQQKQQFLQKIKTSDNSNNSCIASTLEQSESELTHSRGVKLERLEASIDQVFKDSYLQFAQNSTLNQQIKMLDKALGKFVFDKVKEAMDLTAFGSSTLMEIPGYGRKSKS